MKYVQPSEQEIAEVQQRLRNGLNPPHGFALNFALEQPILKYHPDELKKIEDEAEKRTKALDKIEEEDAAAMSVDDFLAIESLAQQPRVAAVPGTPGTPPTVIDKKP